METLEKKTVVNKTKELTVWWVGERRKKLVGLSHDSMAVNPFLAPLLMGMNGFDEAEQLAAFLIGGHFSTGHATGFGKLVDEKILPNVFQTTKLSAGFRRTTPPFQDSIYDEIDHIKGDLRSGSKKLLSLKAGRWTIQLTMSVQLNRAFYEIIQKRSEGSIDFSEIAVGVFYGKKENLTDKYDIIRGQNRGANHSVFDIKNDVNVYAGKDFWKWLNDGEESTQEWVLQGLIEGFLDAKKKIGPIAPLVKSYQASFVKELEKFYNEDGSIDWFGLLRDVNG